MNLFKTNESAVQLPKQCTTYTLQLQPISSHCNNTAWQKSHWFLANRGDAAVYTDIVGKYINPYPASVENRVSS